MNNYGFVKIACACPKLKVANPSYNKDEIIKVINEAYQNGAKVLLTPELSISSYTCADLFFNDTLLKGCEDALSEIVENSAGKDMAIIVGMPIRHRLCLYNCAVVILNGEILGVVPKEYIANYSEFYEKRWFASGSDVFEEIRLCGENVSLGSFLFDLGSGIIMGIEICEDLWVPIPPSSKMSLSGANLILNLSASNELVTKDEYRTDLIKMQSATNICAYMYASSGVHESTTDLLFSGSLVIAENGSIISKGKRFSRENEIIYGFVDIEKLNHERIHNTSFNDNAKQSFYDSDIIEASLEDIELSGFNRYIDPHPFVPDNEDLRLERCREIFNIQSSALAKRLEHTSLKSLVVGISGGLDSTLALLVASETMKLLGYDSKNIIGVTMPGFGTTDRTYTNAINLMKSLGVTIKEISIKDACIQHMKDIDHDPSIHDITYENTQARERTKILMNLSNKYGGLLVGTGDLSEMALGWCTYNGDHMSMYAVNVSIPKTLVSHLVDTVARFSDDKTKEILMDVLDTPVSPELLPPTKDGKIAQKTEDNIGPYELHDFFLYHFMRFGSTKEKIFFLAKEAFKDKYTDEIIAKWLDNFMRRFFISQFKRSCVPDGPKVGSVSLSPRGDLRMPSDADFSLWMK